MKRQIIRNIRLIVGASEATRSGGKIDPEFTSQVEQARIDIAATRGTQVVDALLVLNQSAMTLALDVRQRAGKTVGREELSEPPEHRRGRF